MRCKRVLVLSPHPDDGEIGCGATMARFIDEGATVYHALFCAAENIGDQKVKQELRYNEFARANKLMGIPPAAQFTFDFPHRHLEVMRQTILDEMVNLNASIKPHLVLMPCLHDLHQDHRVIADEGVRAFKRTNVWGYEMLWNNLTFNTHTFVRVDTLHIEKKERSIMAYESQKHRDYINGDFIRSHARARGVQAGMKHAEAFEHIRGIVL